MTMPQRGNSGDVWLTPKHIIDALGKFDLDPCAAPLPRPWETASASFVEADDGLSQEWFGRVWMNPPYGRGIGAWMKKMAEHAKAGGGGISLVDAFKLLGIKIENSVIVEPDKVQFLLSTDKFKIEPRFLSSDILKSNKQTLLR